MDHYAIQIYNVFSTVTSTPLSAPPETSWITISTALLTPLIALLAVYIAWAQAHTARQKLKLDLYDRRLIVFETAKKFLISSMARTGSTTEIFMAQLEYQKGVAGAKWLFNEEIEDYLNQQVWEVVAALTDNGMRRAALSNEDDRQPLNVEHREIFNRANEVLKNIDGVFYKYLHITH